MLSHFNKYNIQTIERAYFPFILFEYDKLQQPNGNVEKKRKIEMRLKKSAEKMETNVVCVYVCARINFYWNITAPTNAIPSPNPNAHTFYLS